MKKIAIFIEKKSDKLASVGLELLSETRRKVGYSAFLIAIVLGAQIGEEEINQLKVVGPDEIVIAEHDLLKVYDTHYYTTVLSDIVAKHTFDVLLLGSTILGRDLAPRLSARLHTGLTADATILDFDVSDDRISLLATRPALGVIYLRPSFVQKLYRRWRVSVRVFLRLNHSTLKILKSLIIR